YNHVLVVKGNLLMHAYLTRTEIKNPSMQKDLDYMLRNCTNLLDAMVEHSNQRGWLGACQEIITFAQHVTQAAWGKDCDLLQLPHFTSVEVGHVLKGKEGVKGVKEYIKLPEEDRKGLADFTEEQKEDVHKACKLIPDVEVTVETFVEDDEDAKIYQNDLITVRVNVDRLNLEQGEEAGLVHAPFFPIAKQESWWVILATKDSKIVNIQKVTKKEKKFSHDIKFMAPPKGEYDMDVYVMSNAYVGIDNVLPVNFTVLDPELLPVFKPHKDDLALDEEPTMFEQMMAGNIEEDSEDDDSDSDDEKETRLQQQGAGGAKGKKGGDDSDSDSDSDDDGPPPLNAEAKKDK
ncbi:hypothetical protein TeGR_g14736, partial [Tetraparma gracilis]